MQPSAQDLVDEYEYLGRMLTDFAYWDNAQYDPEVMEKRKQDERRYFSLQVIFGLDG